jgi:hypothetical protein
MNGYRLSLQSLIGCVTSILLLSLLTASSISAQTGSSMVSGSVLDNQGQAIVGARVTLKNEGKNFTRAVTTDDSGSFTFTIVPPDTYSLEVEATGFKKSVLTEVAALVDNKISLNVELEVGAVTEVVSVSASSVENIINTQDASLGNNFVSRQILQLPLNARNVAGLLSLQPAVTSDGYVAGGRSDQANLTIDGLDANDQQDGTALSPVLRVTPDSVEEFRVTTVNANATQGRSSGAQVSLITRSGGNDFHGALYEYHRNTVTTANDFFNNRTIDPKTGKSIPRPKLIRNVFGGRLGGPIIKDRLFFFYNYEGRRDAKQVSVVRIVPLASLGRGEVKFNANVWENGQLVNRLITLTPAQINALTSTGLASGAAVVDTNPAALAVLAGAAQRYPSNDDTTGDLLNTGGYRFNAPLPVKFNTHTARMDWKPSENHTFFLRGNYQHDLLTFTTRAQQFPDTPTPNTWSHPLGLGVSYTWTVSSSLINNFRYGITRDAFSDQGDSSVNAVTFREVFSDAAYFRTFSRVTPVQNFTNDLTWLKGSHSWQFGTNIRTVRNRRTNFGAAFDNGITNQSFYSGAGAVVSSPVNAYLNALYPKPASAPASAATSAIRADNVRTARTALTAVFGRLSQYGANFNFGIDGAPLAPGAPVVREFATEEYDLYAQDAWRIRPELTVTLGLRYGLSRPVYETQGFQAKPNVGLQDYLQKRIAASKQGQNFVDPIQIVLAGPFHDKPGFYELDKNNFQPRIAVAWQPKFNDSVWGKVFGRDGASVFRGGFAIMNDYFGQALAVNFDGNNRLGFSSNQTIAANTYNVTTNPAPLFTGIGQPIRGLPRITVPGNLTFPQQQPSNNARRIEGSLDSNLVSPINYTWNFTYSRTLPGGLAVEASYIGRRARNLLAARDVMAINNITDPKSGVDWYTAAGMLEDLRLKNTPISQIPNIAFFDNLYAAGSVAFAVDDYIGTDFVGARLTNTQAAYAMMVVDAPGCAALGGCGAFGSDWTSLQDALDFGTGRPLFYHPQYGALAAYGTIGSSDYHGGTLSVRQRFRNAYWDFNYTLSKSMDDASGLQTSGVYDSAFILNALRQRDNRSVSDFDIRHIVNFNSVVELPVGRNRWLLGNANRFVDAVLGGWELGSIFRWNSGRVAGDPFDANGWATNWNARSNGVRIRPLKESPTRGSGTAAPNLFTDPKAAYQSYRSPRPGETGDRNIIRYPGFVSLDFGLYKSFKMPYSENHKVQFRWEVFNVTNTQRLTGLADFSIGLDPQNGSPQPNFGNFTGIQGDPRIMQFALRYDF